MDREVTIWAHLTDVYKTISRRVQNWMPFVSPKSVIKTMPMAMELTADDSNTRCLPVPMKWPIPFFFLFSFLALNLDLLFIIWPH